jgi:hypothetical protein
VKYLKRAIDLYRRWGAKAKAEWLENKERYRHAIFRYGLSATKSDTDMS